MTTGPPTRTIELPEDLVRRVEARLPKTEWDEAEAYVKFVLEEVLTEVESEADEVADFDAVDEEEIRDRLESLGYLNE